MALVLEQINAPGLAQLSYLIGDDKAGVVAVVDSQRDADVYLQMARKRGLRITLISFLVPMNSKLERGLRFTVVKAMITSLIYIN